jgi:hypothetical protein
VGEAGGIEAVVRLLHASLGDLMVHTQGWTALLGLIQHPGSSGSANAARLRAAGALPLLQELDHMASTMTITAGVPIVEQVQQQEQEQQSSSGAMHPHPRLLQAQPIIKNLKRLLALCRARLEETTEQEEGQQTEEAGEQEEEPLFPGGGNRARWYDVEGDEDEEEEDEEDDEGGHVPWESPLTTAVTVALNRESSPFLHLALPNNHD